MCRCYQKVGILLPPLCRTFGEPQVVRVGSRAADARGNGQGWRSLAAGRLGGRAVGVARRCGAAGSRLRAPLLRPPQCLRGPAQRRPLLARGQCLPGPARRPLAERGAEGTGRRGPAGADAAPAARRQRSQRSRRGRPEPVPGGRQDQRAGRGGVAGDRRPRPEVPGRPVRGRRRGHLPGVRAGLARSVGRLPRGLRDSQQCSARASRAAHGHCRRWLCLARRVCRRQRRHARSYGPQAESSYAHGWDSAAW
mmetsp:Transcript_21332/g.60416  ORF Transcript_21332/g.60416 Transcript_21332/m.60416 type:complete len:252 (-) Transcript_21332:1173-1928(-)